MCFCHAAPVSAAIIRKFLRASKKSLLLPQVVFLPSIFVYYRICGTAEDRHAGHDMLSVLRRHSIIPLRQLTRLSAFLGVFYLLCDYFWFSALQNLTVAAGAAIFNSSPLFVYCFSICLLHEQVSCKKLFGVLMAFTGVTIEILYQDNGKSGGIGSPSVVVGLMMLTSVILNAGYNVTFALTAGANINDTPTLMIMMGLSGIFTFPAWLVGTLFFAHSPFPSLYEPIGYPSSIEGNVMLAIGVVMFTTNFIFLTFAVCWTSPLETSVGFMLTIPLAGLIDTYVRHAPLTWEFFFGAALVMTGFCILEMTSLDNSSNANKHTNVDVDTESA
ncbi:EamA-like transporter family [Phytophthora infestans]|nr:EamA-like transporter family [Phytophthora infestans]